MECLVTADCEGRFPPASVFRGDPAPPLYAQQMMQNLVLEEGTVIRLSSATLPKGSFVKLQPHSKDFLDITNPRAVLETTLRNFTCLTGEAGAVILSLWGWRMGRLSPLSVVKRACRRPDILTVSIFVCQCLHHNRGAWTPHGRDLDALGAHASRTSLAPVPTGWSLPCHVP